MPKPNAKQHSVKLVSASTNVESTQGNVPPNLAELITSLDREIDDALKEETSSLVAASQKHDEVDLAMRSIDTLYDKIKHDNKLSNYHRSKLKTLYTAAYDLCDAEAESIRSCLSTMAQIRKLRNERHVRKRQLSARDNSKPPIRRGTLMLLLQQNAQSLPLWIGRLHEEPAPLCGAVPAEPDYVCSVGDMVAARVQSGEGDQNWILAEVSAYNESTGKYEIDDIDEEQKEHHTLSRRKVIPLPLFRANPDTDSGALFSHGALVFALYPQTTCFYRGVVEQVPRTAADSYLVSFEDNSYPSGYSPALAVPQRYVVRCKDSDLNSSN